MTEPDRDRRTIAVAEEVARTLERHGLRSAVIGALALAAHGYSRATEDLDLGAAADPFTTLPRIQRELEERGWTAHLAQPDAEDPLGGVLTVTGPDFDPVQVVNFVNPLRRRAHPGVEAVATAQRPAGGPALAIVDIPHLVAMKLFTGARRDELDVLELLDRLPAVPVDELRAICSRYRLTAALDRVLAEIGLAGR